MGNYGEVGVTEHIQLMKDYLAGRINLDQYSRSYFALSKKRANISDQAYRITNEPMVTQTTMNPTPRSAAQTGSEDLN
jgi:hypothetical protein